MTLLRKTSKRLVLVMTLDVKNPYQKKIMNHYLKRIKNTIFIALVAFLYLLPSCSHKKTPKKANPHTYIHLESNQPSIKANNSKEKHVLTIWIHGTTLFSRKLSGIFHAGKIGIHPASSYKKSHRILRKISQYLPQEKTSRFVYENFYFFGWHGKLSVQRRTKTAENLLRNIIQLIKSYKTKHGATPKIRIITHSHGGNVALSLAKANKNSKEKITIYELILLACPVQKKTAHLTKDPIFENIYSLYSGIDMLQVIDPQGLQDIKKTRKIKKPFFSKRLFPQQKNLKQAKVKINGRGLLHIEFITSRFVKMLPHILEEIDAWTVESQILEKKSRLLRIYKKRNKVRLERRMVKKKW